MTSSNRPFIFKHAIPIIAAITAIALILRIIVCICFAQLPAVVNPSVQTDMATYIRLSNEILHGQWPDHFDYQPFYYTVFLPICRMLGGDSPWPSMLLQAILGSVAVWLTGISASKLFGKVSGIAAALLLALSKIHVFYTPFALFEVLQSFWLALILWLALYSWSKNKIWQWCLLSLTVSAAALTRGNAMLLVPGMLCLVIWRNWSRKSKAALLAVCLLAIYLAPQLPFSITNYKYTGRWCGPSTAGDKVLALGNTPEAPAGGLEYPLTYHEWVADSDKKPGEGRVSVPQHILKWMCKEPFAFFELKFRSLLLFWDHREIANNVSLQLEGKECFLTSYPTLLSFTIIGPMALLGLFVITRRFGRKNKKFGIGFAGICILTYMILSSWFGTSLFYNLARFRLSALPLLCVSGGAGIRFFRNIIVVIKKTEDRAQRRRLLQANALPLVLVLFLVYSAYSTYQSYIEPMAMRTAHPNGIVADFDDTLLVYDHGPLVFGGMNFISIPEKGLNVAKAIIIPENAPAGQATVRYPVYLSNGARLSGYMLHGGKQYAFSPSQVQTDRFNKWIEIKLDNITVEDKRMAVFIWHFDKDDNMGIGIDRLRDFGRTSYVLSDKTELSMKAEAAMEIQWYK